MKMKNHPDPDRGSDHDEDHQATNRPPQGENAAVQTMAQAGFRALNSVTGGHGFNRKW
jgi:hypothetical protein